MECVPNFSEGRDMRVIQQITDAIASVSGVRVLHVDPGYATNRTVVTFAGNPNDVVEAAFRGVAKAAELIDMRYHHGTHPRQGATDVLPLVPISGITLKECAELARQLADRMARELGIPCYCYEAAAYRPAFRNLAVCRAGEYEALHDKLTDPARQPDKMPADLSKVERTGCSVVGARNYLIAVNFNLNTTDKQIAHAIACDIRESGRKVTDANGNIVHQSGTLKCVKAIGWYIEEYGIAQVSVNLTDISITSLHVAYDEVCRCAALRGVKVTGTEIIGMLPESVLLDAGRHYLKPVTTNVSPSKLIDAAIHNMHLDDLKPFIPQEKIIEFAL